MNKKNIILCSIFGLLFLGFFILFTLTLIPKTYEIIKQFTTTHPNFFGYSNVIIAGIMGIMCLALILQAIREYKIDEKEESQKSIAHAVLYGGTAIVTIPFCIPQLTKKIQEIPIQDIVRSPAWRISTAVLAGIICAIFLSLVIFYARDTRRQPPHNLETSNDTTRVDPNQRLNNAQPLSQSEIRSRSASHANYDD